MTRRFWERLRTIVSLQRDRFWFAREPRTVAPAQVAAPLPLAALLPPPAV